MHKEAFEKASGILFSYKSHRVAPERGSETESGQFGDYTKVTASKVVGWPPTGSETESGKFGDFIER